MKILVTGGAGYIGSVIVHKLVKLNYNVVVIDNLSSGHKEILPKCIIFYHGDINDLELLNEIFSKNGITHVIHCAAYIDVNESTINPIKYFENNVANGINLLKIMEMHKCNNIIFSSTCATYGNSQVLPLTESSLQSPVNAYGHSKLIFEQILDYMEKIRGFNITILRYFNVAGAYIDKNIIVGENHNPETHLIPLIFKAIDNNMPFNIYGTDYQTNDGTCVRDFIHVEDLADAHIIALNNHGKYNLGSEKGYSVKEIICIAEEIVGKQLNLKLCPRREGDPPVLYADATKIKNELNWKPNHDINSIISSAYIWHNRMTSL